MIGLWIWMRRAKRTTVPSTQSPAIMSSHKKSLRKVDMAGKTYTYRDSGGSHCTDPSFRVVVLVVFLINFHTWGMNSVSRRRVVLYLGTPVLTLISGIRCVLSLLPHL